MNFDKNHAVAQSACNLLLVTVLQLTVTASPVMADGGGIDKIYHPYVQPLEREIELRSSIEEGSNSLSDDRQTWRLGYGQSFNEHWFGEAYLIAEKNNTDHLSVTGYALEALWQLTEQGEYPVDAGLLFEIEKSDDPEVTELASTLLLEKEWGRWAGTANLRAMYEYGSAIKNEPESAAALQLRYRYAMEFEPALEFYSSENILGLGPVALGNLSFGKGRKLHWETGLIAGLGRQTPDSTLRLLLEYEF